MISKRKTLLDVQCPHCGITETYYLEGEETQYYLENYDSSFKILMVKFKCKYCKQEITEELYNMIYLK